jgi:hypothetical protein
MESLGRCGGFADDLKAKAGELHFDIASGDGLILDD